MQEPTHNEPHQEHTLVLEGRASVADAAVRPYAETQHVAADARRGERILAMIIALLITGSVTVGGAVVGYEATKLPAVAPSIAMAPTNKPDVEQAVPSVAHPFMQVSVGARAYVVYDVHREMVLASSNKDAPLPLASLTKVMTSLVALESAREDTRLAISPTAIETEGDSGLLAQETWKLKDLVSFTMITSSNDGASAIASAVGGLWHSTPEVVPEYERVVSFVDHMNQRARELGLHNTTFRNPSGLDVSQGVEGGRGSAEDMAKLFAYAWEHEPAVFTDTVYTRQQYVSEDGFTHEAENTNERVDNIHGLMGSKTGYTELAGGNLGIIYNSGMDHPIVVVVLGSTRDGRFDDVEKLVDATYAYIESGWYQYEVAGSSEEQVRM